jgi:hypothetical protein
MAAHRYWRLNITSTWSADVWCSVATLIGWSAGLDGDQLKSSLGVTCTASSTFGGFPATNANDNNNGTYWITGAFANPTTLTFDLGVGVFKDIRQISFTSRTDTFYGQFPKDYNWQWSDDNISWTTAFSGTTTSPTAAGQFYTSPSAGAASFERTTQAEALAALRISGAANRTTEAFILTAINYPTASERVTKLNGLVSVQSNLTLRTTQSEALVAVLYGAEERMLRAWTFTQDGHDFYVVITGGETYVYDKETEQWAQWASPDAAFWRGVDGVEWQGINVCIDPDTGKLFQIDPQGRLDYKTTPITSIVYGGLTERFRNMPSIFMAEVAVSQNSPPHNVDPTTLSITLETTDTITSYNHGTVNGATTGNHTFARFYGLGLMRSPGMLFKITDTGFARRIDGLNIEMSGTPDNG